MATKKKQTMKIRLEPYGLMPERAHPTDAGLDIKTPKDFTVPPRGFFTVDTGVAVELPPGTVGMLKSKSGLNVNRDCVTEGVIDEGYTGTIRVKVYNHGNKAQKFRRGDKITQLVVVPVVVPELVEADELEESERGSDGFGSTGR